MNDGLKKFIAAGLGTGYLWPWPGTWGSLGAAVVMGAVLFGTGGNYVAFNITGVVIVVVASVACVRLGRFAQDAFGKKDPRQSTLDEWAGQAITLLGLPPGPDPANWHSWFVSIGTGFVFFRLFDSVKPPPLRALEKLPHGWGVLADDLLAGLYANITIQILLRAWLLPTLIAHPEARP